MATTYPVKIDQTIGNSSLQEAIYTATGRLIDKRKSATKPQDIPDFEERRTRANLLKKHTIDNLDFYLEQTEKNITARGGKVVYCNGAEDVAQFVVSLAKERGAKLFVKSKSMTSEEINCS